MKIYRYLLLILLFFSFHSLRAESGGPLSVGQAAYDVLHYDLNLTIDPDQKSIEGTLVCSTRIINPISSIELDLDDALGVSSTSYQINGGSPVPTTFTHSLGKLYINLSSPVVAGDIVSVRINYGGNPIESANPPWDAGFVWRTTPSGGPWVGVACEKGGADIWWPCKDHPSDEPDSMSMSFTVQNPLTCVSNGKFMGYADNGDGTSTWNWIVTTPINNYNITVYIAEYDLISADYESVSGDTIPFRFWVLPDNLTQATNHLDVFKNEFDFQESLFGPFPFGMDKHGWAHAPYWGMEHQTVIAYGHNFSINGWGMDYIHYHELAHEWWGNFITAKSWSDLWIHEGLATYAEALYVEHLSGKALYHQYMNARRPEDNHSHALAPLEDMGATLAYANLNSYNRGAAALHTLRYYLGDAVFFEVLERWAYPDSNDFDNTAGRLCRVVNTEDMKNVVESVSGRDMDPFFNAFFRSASYPSLQFQRQNETAYFTWLVDSRLALDLNIPIQIDGVNQIVHMNDSEGSISISDQSVLVIDPDKWILMAEPIVGVIEDPDITLAGYQLQENYPNPFNGMTNIKFSIPEQKQVVLSIFNLQGQEVLRPVNQTLEAGNHRVSLDANGFSSGVYFYQLHSDDFIETKKFTIIR